MNTIQHLLAPHEDQLLFITRRLFVMEAFAKELDRVTRGKAFRICHGILWMMLLDSRDAHVTHFGSWLKALYSGGGLFGRLQAHHLRAFPRKWKAPSIDRPDFIARMLKEHHDSAFQKLFPGATGAYPTGRDIQALQQEFIAKVTPVVADRNDNRAHPYERSGSATASAKMLDVKELRAITDYVESLLNSLRLLSTSSTLSYRDMNAESSDVVAGELVDSVLFGTRTPTERLIADGKREEFYARLHEHHDRIQGTKKPLFNDPQILTSRLRSRRTRVPRRPTS